jgi:hypothetical protein
MAFYPDIFLLQGKLPRGEPIFAGLCGFRRHEANKINMRLPILL